MRKKSNLSYRKYDTGRVKRFREETEIESIIDSGIYDNKFYRY